jgi:hypothetical protein
MATINQSYKSVSIKHSDDSIKVAHTVGNKKLIDDKTIDIHLDRQY